MYSGKPSLKTFANGRAAVDFGTPSKVQLTAAGPLQDTEMNRGMLTSENCDPNLSVDREVARKAGSPFQSLEDITSKKSKIHGNVSQLPALDTRVDDAQCDNAGEPAKLSNEATTTRPVAAKALASPTKNSTSPAHGHRLHVCRSPRCASNNPDYAIPAQSTPRKYLISKRHLLPGAICTRDPATLVNQAQESPAEVPSSGKPPKPQRKLENVFRQPSFTNVSSAATVSMPEASPPPPASRIPKPPSARSPSCLESRASTASPSSLSQLPLPSSSHSESILPSKALEPLQLFTAEESPSAAAIPIDRSAELGNATDNSTSSDAEVSSHDVIASHSSLICNAGEADLSGLAVTQSSSDIACTVGDADLSCEDVVPSSAPSTGNAKEISDDFVEPHQFELSAVATETNFPVLSSLEKLFLPTFAPLTDSRRVSSISVSKVEHPSQPSPPPSVHSSPDLASVTEKLARSLSMTPQVTGQEVADLTSDGEISGADATHISQTDLQEAASMSSSQDWNEPSSMSEMGCQFGERKGNTQLQVEVPVYDYSQKNSIASFIKNFEGAQNQGSESSVSAETEVQEMQPKASTRPVWQRQVKEETEDRRKLSSQPEWQRTPLGETDGVQKPRTIASFIENYESTRTQDSESPRGPEWQRGVPKTVRGKGRQLWRSDCRDSREVVFLKQSATKDKKAGGDWMVDNLLEGAISKLNPSGQGRVRVLVEAFESLLNVEETEVTERRASRVWCLNRMEKGEVDEDGDEFEEGDQRVDCYEVSGDGLQLRASMRLSLGGGSRLGLCTADDASEIEMSAIQKVQEWNDDCLHQSTTPGSQLENSFQDDHRSCDESQHSLDEVIHNQDDGREEQTGNPELSPAQQRRISYAHIQSSEESERFTDDYSTSDGGQQFECSPGDAVKQRIDDLDLDYKFKASRRRRFWKPSFAKPKLDASCSNRSPSPERDQRVIRGTTLEPFRLATEERGAVKEFQFNKKMEQMLEDEERMRNPIAQGLPFTTDEPENVPKPAVKEQTRPVEFRHFSNSRAIERADFDNYVAERTAYVDLQRQEEEKLRLLAEQEDVKRLRREMVPRAQLMPYFDQPFVPTRSSKRLTVPKEPSFNNRETKRAKCFVWQDQHSQQNHHF